MTDSVAHLRPLVELNASDPKLLERELSAILATSSSPPDGRLSDHSRTGRRKHVTEKGEHTLLVRLPGHCSAVRMGIFRFR
jgi:hypothetical protein